jgi:alpha-tubulin suppressor-like RCC1 family protein
LKSQYRILIAVIIVVVLGIAFHTPSTVLSRSSAEILSAIAVGADHACAIKANNEVVCWGTNYAGQLGFGYGLQESLPPIKVTGLSGAIKIVAGNAHTCALLETGNVKCWGINQEGELGVGDTYWAGYTPVDVTGLSSDIIDIAAGWQHTCALMNTGVVKCWGMNAWGQLGDGTTTLRAAPVDVTGLPAPALKISAGEQHTCAILNTGAAMCWGGNWAGQLGNGTYDNSAIPVAVTGLTNGAQAIAAGHSHTCASTGTGAKCWGRNDDGQLGDGTHNFQTNPVDVISFSDGVKELSAGLNFTCALTAQGGVKCWGRNAEGQLGDGTQIDRTSPVAASGLSSGVKAISSRQRNSCVALNDGTYKCWGMDEHAQAGDGTPSRLLFPGNSISFSGTVKEISAGPNDTCIATTDNKAFCWGYNSWGQLGDGTQVDRSSPIQVWRLAQIAAVVNGADHSCALDDVGGAWCWGLNWTGQVGDGSRVHTFGPVQVIGLTIGITKISAGENHTCAVTSTGGLKCWGANWAGQLGNNSQAASDVPVDVSGLGSGVIDVEAGPGHTCALLSDGEVKCWGSNTYGQLGDGTTTDSLVPVTVSGLPDAKAISVGTIHTCALTTAGGMKCWGSNNDGELGDGTFIDRATPIDVLGLTSGVARISGNGWHGCAALTTGELLCWGYNGAGQLGDGTIVSNPTPAVVSGLGGSVQSLQTGEEHTCVLLTNGQVKCWGGNGFGQLGLGDTPWRKTPVIVKMNRMMLPMVTK